MNLDVTALRSHLGPDSDWARDNGRRVHDRRESLGLTVKQVAEFCNVPVQTIYKLESGDLAGRDYLRHSVAHVLCCEVGELFPPMTREQIASFMDDAA